MQKSLNIRLKNLDNKFAFEIIREENLMKKYNDILIELNKNDVKFEENYKSLEEFTSNIKYKENSKKNSHSHSDSNSVNNVIILIKSKLKLFIINICLNHYK